jgi:hypothetical protein
LLLNQIAGRALEEFLFCASRHVIPPVIVAAVRHEFVQRMSIRQYMDMAVFKKLLAFSPNGKTLVFALDQPEFHVCQVHDLNSSIRAGHVPSSHRKSTIDFIPQLINSGITINLTLEFIPTS